MSGKDWKINPQVAPTPVPHTVLIGSGADLHESGVVAGQVQISTPPPPVFTTETVWNAMKDDRDDQLKWYWGMGCYYPELLYSSVTAGYTKCVKFLLGQNIPIDNDRLQCCFNYAAGEGHTETVELLIPRIQSAQGVLNNGFVDFSRPATPDVRVASQSLNKALKNASEYGRVGVVKLLLAVDGVDPNASLGYPIGYASKNGHVEVVRVLLAHPNIMPELDGNYALKYAVTGKHIEVVKLLCSRASVIGSTYYWDIVHIAIRNKDPDTLRYMLSVQRDGVTAHTYQVLHTAASTTGNLDCYNVLAADARFTPSDYWKSLACKWLRSRAAPETPTPETPAPTSTIAQLQEQVKLLTAQNKALLRKLAAVEMVLE